MSGLAEERKEKMVKGIVLVAWYRKKEVMGSAWMDLLHSGQHMSFLSRPSQGIRLPCAPGSDFWAEEVAENLHDPRSRAVL